MDKVHEIKKYHDQDHVFKDRFEAGEVLGGMLETRYAQKADVVALAIPSGGIPVGLKISEALACPYDLIIVRKLQIPGNPEAGFGAMTQEGTVFLNERLVADLLLTDEQIEQETQRVKAELDKRNNLFRGGSSFPDLAGKQAIIADDGLASGYTMLTSIYSAKKAGAREVVVAVPTAPLRTIESVQSGVDEIYCANIRESTFFAVADAYKQWHDLNEQEVLQLLGKGKEPGI
jgi:predicted phosphoribosyltransferase